MLKDNFKILLEDTKYEPFKVWHIFSWSLLILSSSLFFSVPILTGTRSVFLYELAELGLYFSMLNAVFHIVLAFYFSYRAKQFSKKINIQRRALKEKVSYCALYVVVFIILLSTAYNSLFS